MMPDESLLRAAAYLAGIVCSIPFAATLWKVALFFAKSITMLEKIDKIDKALSELKHARRSDVYEVWMSLSIIESDINTLQEHNGLPVRPFPDRRTGPTDRRQA